MQSITVNKADLLDKLLENRAKHVEQYEEALAAYRDRAEKMLRQRADQIANGGDVNLNFNLPKPSSHADDYDTAVAMLEWHTDDEVELEQHEFKQFVENDWPWANQFLNVTSQYLG